MGLIVGAARKRQIILEIAQICPMLGLLNIVGVGIVTSLEDPLLGDHTVSRGNVWTSTQDMRDLQMTLKNIRLQTLNHFLEPTLRAQK
jgi:hypothetical protein